MILVKIITDHKLLCLLNLIPFTNDTSLHHCVCCFKLVNSSSKNLVLTLPITFQISENVNYIRKKKEKDLEKCIFFFSSEYMFLVFKEHFII